MPEGILYSPRTVTSCCALKICRKTMIWEILIKGPSIDIAWVMGFVPLYYVQNPKLKITYDFCHYPFNENYSMWLWTEILLSKLKRISSLYTGIPITVKKNLNKKESSHQNTTKFYSKDVIMCFFYFIAGFLHSSVCIMWE